VAPLGATLVLTRDHLPDLPPAGTGIEYWRDGLERRMPRWWELKWRGRVLVRMRSDHNERAYWRRRRELIRLIDEMTTAGTLPPLHADSRVLEPGCNVGQNLWEISRRWRCQVHGIDIDRAALDQAAARAWPRPGQFAYGNVLDPATLSSYADREFDLVLTRWHLIHVPPGDAKTEYLRNLKRIGRAGLILEPTAPDKTGRVEWAEKGTYCLSWDDWAGWYGLKRFSPRTPLPYTDVFYW
jgi:SAM-dependent methyltransferase